MLKKFSGNQLKTAREKKGLRIMDVQFAMLRKGFEVTQQSLYAWEADKNQPNVEKLAVLAEIYGVTIEDFFVAGKPDKQVCEAIK